MPWSPQYFKPNEDLEKRVDNCFEPLLTGLNLQKDDFYNGAYQAAPLGDLIFEDGRSPLANAIAQDIFRVAFNEIFDAFVKVGTFEAYLTVFRKIFGDDVDVEFTVPAPGKLTIEITAEGIEITNFIARHIVTNQYLFDNVVTHDGDQIVFQSIKGFTSQYELEQMLFEMVPNGIFTTITLNLS